VIAFEKKFFSELQLNYLNLGSASRFCVTWFWNLPVQIFSLPATFRLFPGRDYFGRTVTTVGEEKLYNPRLSRSKEEFVKIMKVPSFIEPIRWFSMESVRPVLFGSLFCEVSRFYTSFQSSSI